MSTENGDFAGSSLRKQTMIDSLNKFLLECYEARRSAYIDGDWNMVDYVQYCIDDTVAEINSLRKQNV